MEDRCDICNSIGDHKEIFYAVGRFVKDYEPLETAIHINFEGKVEGSICRECIKKAIQRKRRKAGFFALAYFMISCILLVMIITKPFDGIDSLPAKIIIWLLIGGGILYPLTIIFPSFYGNVKYHASKIQDGTIDKNRFEIKNMHFNAIRLFSGKEELNGYIYSDRDLDGWHKFDK